MQRLELKPTHKPVQNYYAALRQFDGLGVTHETAVRSAFQGLLDHCARQHDWTLVPEWEIRRPRQHPLRVDGALLDNFRLTMEQAAGTISDLLNVARAYFRRQGVVASAFQNMLQVVAAKAVSSAPSN
jgi:hypothetical protein